MKSTCVSTSQRTIPLTAAPLGGAREPLETRYRGSRDPWEARLCRKSVDQLEARVRPEATAHLRRRAAVGQHDVGGEVVCAADQRRADAVCVDGYAVPLELADLLDRE